MGICQTKGRHCNSRYFVDYKYSLQEKGWSIHVYGFSTLYNVQIWADSPTHPSICTITTRKCAHLGWVKGFYFFGFLCLTVHYQLILITCENFREWRWPELILNKKNHKFQSVRIFSISNLHSRNFQTHPRILICTLCNFGKPYTKMNHP